MNLEEEFSEYVKRQNDAEEYADVIELAKALTGMKNGTGLLKEAIELAQETKNAELIRSLSKLNLEMANVESELAIAKREVTHLESENADLKRQLKEARKPSVEMTRKGKLYYKPDGAGPYCPQCWDSQQKAVFVSELDELFVCPKCQYSGKKR